MQALRREAGFSLTELLVVVLLLGIAAGIAVPMADTTARGFRIKGDAQAIANMVALSKMRAASRYSRTRIHADLDTNTFQLEVWVPTALANKEVGSWVIDGGTVRLSRGVTFGFAARPAPPTNTQTVIGQSAECTATDSLDDDPQADTACIVFNSRGIPIDTDGEPTGGNALYITDGSAVYATTVTATPLVRQWWSGSESGGWIQQ